jgi:hypothetical protein
LLTPRRRKYSNEELLVGGAGATFRFKRKTFIKKLQYALFAEAANASGRERGSSRASSDSMRNLIVDEKSRRHMRNRRPREAIELLFVPQPLPASKLSWLSVQRDQAFYLSVPYSASGHGFLLGAGNRGRLQ